MAQTVIGELVASTTAVRYANDQAAVPQAREMVRQPGTGDLQGVGEVGRVAGPLLQGRQDPAADRIGQRAAEPRQGLDVSGGSQHTTTMHRNLNPENPELLARG